MNLSRKIILIVYAFAVVCLTTLYVPYKAKIKNIREHRYYSSIWSDYKPKFYPDDPKRWSVNLNTKVLVIEIFALSVTAGTLFVLLRRKV